SQLIGAINRKPVTTPDGLTDEQAAAPNQVAKYTPLLLDLGRLRGKDAVRIVEGIRSLIFGEPMNDRNLYLEHGVEFVQKLPPNSALGEKLANLFIKRLWVDLPHPPAMYIGPKDRYRSADGSGNNPHLPELGKSGTPYSRSVPPVQPRPAALPEPELVYDMLLRREGFKPHPSGLNRVFFSFATVVIHELFQTSRENPWINETTSYVDLSTLYGNNAAEQEKVRTYENGRIWPDVISSDRIMRMPPAVIAVLLLFSRNHNYIAKRLLEINESGKYVLDTSTLNEDKKRWQDEDIFQLSRNINVAFFANCVLRYYVTSILNTLRADSTWHLWTFGGLERGPDGHFDNVQLAELIKDAVEEPAHAFGARSIPAALKTIEILGQLHARNVFQVCTTNEFRKYLNLKPFESFLEWNSDPAIAKAAEQLYVHIDNLELYPGLLAEESKPAMPGSGLCPGHTIGRGILDDAVSLIRSDRFLTHDLNISTLTSWGMSQMQPQGGAYGGMLSTLLFRALPGAWSFNSTYCLFPFYTPPAIRQILRDNKVEELYDTDRPASDMAVHGIYSFEACKNIFLDRENFHVLYGHNILEVTNGSGFMIMYDDHKRHDPLHDVIFEPFFTRYFEDDVMKYFTSHTRSQIEKCAIHSGKRTHIDVVRDIANVVPITWLAQKYGIPLKTQETPHGILSTAELLMTLIPLFIYT
ncbi:hypothetical protein CF319_g8959, partial [Tilletia indica]